MTNHLILKILHKIASKFHTSKLQKEELHYINDANLAAKNIVNLLLSEKPCMIARFGSIELTVIVRYLSMLKYKSKYMSYILGETPNWWWEKNLMKSIQNNAGFINPTPENLKKFSVRMMEDMQLVDILGSWCKEELLFKAELNNALKVRLRYLEPFWGDSPWTKALKDKKVLIIHPFAETVMKQYEKREFLFKNSDTLPKFKSLQVIKAVQSIGGNSEYKDWFEALHSMELEMNKADYEVCLIGCGAYGFPLAAHAKRTGHKAIHLGGALQLLFGIAGKRWFDPSNTATYQDYKDLLNEHWVYPSETERPKAANTVEGGCYW